MTQGTNYGLGIAEVVPGFMGHSGAVSGFQAVIGYAAARGATIVVLANSFVGPNMLLIDALPADRMAATIQRTLFPAAATAESAAARTATVPAACA